MSLTLPKAQAEQLSKVLLEDLLVEVLIRGGRALRTPELAQQGSNGITLSRDYLKQELKESERIVFANRKWDLHFRCDAPHKPLEGYVENALRSLGRPVDSESLAHELASVKGKSERYFFNMVPRLLSERAKYVEIHGEVYILEDWLLEVSAQDEQQVIVENFLDKDPDFEAIRSQVAGKRFSASGETADWIAKILEFVGRPVHHRTISFLLWREQGRQFDPIAIWRALYDDERLRIVSTGHCLTSDMAEELKLQIAQRLKQCVQAGKAEEAVDIAAMLKKKLTKAQTVNLTTEDFDEVAAFLKEITRPANLPELTGDLFDLSANDDEYVGTVQALAGALGKDSRFEDVGAHQFHLKELVPEAIHEIPDMLNIERVIVRTMDDEEVDMLLEDAGLEGGLAAAVSAAEWEDTGEEFDVARVAKNKKSRDSVRYAVPYYHYLSGTMKYRELDDEFFGMETGLMYVTLEDLEYGRIPAWISEETGLIYGLESWYQERLEPCGSVLHILPTAQPGIFQLTWKREKDSLLYVSQERIEELKSMREEAASKPMSVFDIMGRIMSQHGRGVEFITLWAEVNIVRRTSKRMVASLLSGYHCFYQPSGKSGTFFTFDERKLDQGFNGKKRRYIKKDEMM